LTWIIEVRCTIEEAAAAELDGVTIAAHERDDATWRLTAYSEERPGETLIAAVARLAPSAGKPPQVRELPQRDWVKFSQSALVPVTVGRFHVYSAAHAHTLRPGRIGLRIEAGRAFGTGHHATTTGCLAAIDRAAREGVWVRRALDLGTGTGVLALGIARRWRRAQVVAADIDPEAVVVARGNLRANAARGGRRAGMIDLSIGSGPQTRRLAGRYDLVVANILARPLVHLAPGLARAVAPGGRLVLAGLLQGQARRVWAAYRARGLVTVRYPARVAWPVLEFLRPGCRAPPSAGGVRHPMREKHGKEEEHPDGTAG